MDIYICKNDFRIQIPRRKIKPIHKILTFLEKYDFHPQSTHVYIFT